MGLIGNIVKGLFSLLALLLLIFIIVAVVVGLLNYFDVIDWPGWFDD